MTLLPFSQIFPDIFILLELGLKTDVFDRSGRPQEVLRGALKLVRDVVTETKLIIPHLYFTVISA